jgi:endonuclease/exonuclease/phosphatase family protein
MKKLLLTILSLFIAIMAFALDNPAEVSFANLPSTWPTKQAEAADFSNVVLNDVTFNFTKCCKSNSTLLITGKNNSGSAGFDFKIDGTVTKVELTTPSGGTLASGPVVKMSVADVEISSQTWTNDKDKTYTYEVPVDKQVAGAIVKFAVSSKNAQLATMKIYYKLADDAVAAPTISCDDNNMVTITSSDADASIYYTTNGDTPTASSTKYTAPFSITEDTTIKAIAAKGTVTSAVNTFNVVYVATYANFADMKDGGADKVSKVTNLKVVYQNGQNLYLYDETNNGMLYFGNYDTFAAGTVFASVKGTYTLYGKSETPEVTGATFAGQATGTPVEPEEFSAEEASVDKRYKYVIMTDVAINNLSGQNFVFTDASGNIAGYNKFNLATVAVGTGYTVVGIVDVYNNNPQVIPVSVTGGVVTEVVADPVIAPAAGYVKAGTEVTITCETEGAKIYYTTDNVNPTAESTEYTGAFELTASCTVKAIAIKKNCVNSKVVSAKYELLAEGENVATYDFTTSGNAENLIDNNDVVPENGNAATNKNGLDGVSFINGPITLTFATGETTSQPRWWKNTNESTELRAYNNNVITLKANKDGFKLVKVLFSGSVNKTVAASIGSYSNGVWEAPQEASQDLESNSIVTLLTLTPAATLNVNNIHVIYAEDPDATTSAIDSIIVDDDEDAPVEYFNIQGVRVNADRLVPGLYIVRQGSKASKIIVK